MQTKLLLEVLPKCRFKDTGARGLCLEGNVFTYYPKNIGVVVIGRNEGERLIRELVWWALILFPAKYGTQILRIAARRSRNSEFIKRLKRAAVTMLVKIAETMGALRYWLGFNGNVKSYRKLPVGQQNGLA